tara:strand:+ start:225362 stop:226366 length:1005 start_codon:yes stop_codon:yes gene_type:complete
VSGFYAATLIKSIGAFVYISLLLIASNADSAERIQADVVTDIDFISPGETAALQVRLENPQDSETVITSAHFTFQRAELELIREFPFLDIIDSTGCSLAQTSANLGHNRACETKSNDVFPVNPGDSVLLTYRVLALSDNAPPGFIIHLKNIKLSMFDANDRYLPDLHVQRDIVRVVADPGGRQELPKLATANPMAGSADVNMTLSLSYPDLVDAGDPFTIGATLENHSVEPFTVQSSSRIRFITREYQVRPCAGVTPCEDWQFTIGANELLTGIKFAVEHESPLFQPGALQDPNPHLLVTDSIGREARVYTDPVQIIVTHHTHLPTLAPLPSRD